MHIRYILFSLICNFQISQFTLDISNNCNHVKTVYIFDIGNHKEESVQLTT